MAMNIGEYPDRVQGSPYVEAVEEKYKLKYAVAVCNALKEADPATFNQHFGSMEECIRAASRYADFNFDTWKVKWPRGLAGNIAAFK